MKQQLSIFCICATFAWAGTSMPSSAETAEKRPEWLIRTQWDFNDTLPNHFRTMQSAMKTDDKAPAPSTVGLSDLKLSASAEFSKTALDKVLAKIGKHKITIVDIRQEPHGYIDGKPVSWFAGHDDIDAGKNVAQINQEEEKKLHELSSEKETTTYQLVDSTKPGVYREGIKPEKMAVSGLETEEQLCKDEGIGYVRIPIPHDHGPSDKQVDQFVDLVKAQGKDGWLHVHCTDGRGRTTTMLVMEDMMRNADKVSLNDILVRQHLLGGANLVNASSDQAWKEADYVERRKFVDSFYNYCKTEIPSNFKQSWTSWLVKHPSK
jgi:protein-tyrosine phosphatase